MPRKSKNADAGHIEAVEEAISKAHAAHAEEGSDQEAVAPGNLNEKIRQLIRLSKEQGYLTFDDINEALPDSVENQEEIDNENLWVVFHPQKQKCQLILRTNWHFYSRTKKTHY